jgi:hypothetical protein
VTWFEAGLWGLGGGFVTQGLDLWSVFRAKGMLPWKVPPPTTAPDAPVAGPLAYLIVEMIRLTAGGVVAAATAASGQVAGPLAALGIGIATPLVVAKIVESFRSPPSEAIRGLSGPAEAHGTGALPGCGVSAQVDSPASTPVNGSAAVPAGPQRDQPPIPTPPRGEEV